MNHQISSRKVVPIIHLLLLVVLFHPVAVECKKSSSSTRKKSVHIESLAYEIYPTRKASESAVIEWGNSAIISALDGVVASFGPQPSLGAYFEVETAPILADPIHGAQEEDDEEYDEDVPPRPVKEFVNQEEIEGNMMILTNEAGFSGVTMAKMAMNAGAAALLVINVDQDNPDFMYSLKPETEQEIQFVSSKEEEDEDNDGGGGSGGVDIPVIMTSMTGGNMLATATITDDMSPDDIPPNNGLPDRIRMYAGGDRPFFEDAIPTSPSVYIIHNLLTPKECQSLLQSSKPHLHPIDDETNNILEHTIRPSSSSNKVINNIRRTILWKGSLFRDYDTKQMDERIEQVTGFPSNQFSDWQINEHTTKSYHAPHYDVHPYLIPIATITVFLNNVMENEDENFVLDVTRDATQQKQQQTTNYKAGGELVYPSVSSPYSPVKIIPQEGLAVVHHNTNEDYEFDPSSIYAELELRPLPSSSSKQQQQRWKYVARRWVYAQSLHPSRRYILPFFAFICGGSLCSFIPTIHDLLLENFGPKNGSNYFDKVCMGFCLGCIGCFILLASIIMMMISKNDNDKSNEKKTKNGTKATKTKAKTTSTKKGGGGEDDDEKKEVGRSLSSSLSSSEKKKTKKKKTKATKSD